MTKKNGIHMTKMIAVASAAMMLSIASANAAIPSDNACPDLAGTYKTQDGATFTMTSQIAQDGAAVFGYDGDTWIADGQQRDSHKGTLNPSECPSVITCQDKVLNRSYTCYGIKSVEVYSLDRNGNINVSGQGMGLNGNFIYQKVK